ncbi:ECF transporter S component [Mycolicibacterium septicum]|uniref:ECF transporter S component n=1 Tax=Mycolicibacterium septicum TaxID=98668 RepID=UPI0023E2C1A6|nr:ECF transporter S component [Mycolicibacterium septicum]MDF3338951.1 ECF transporter S component [Mycolicibacterium septicum]
MNTSADTTPAARALSWRVVDIVVASVLATASGLVFVVWNIASNPISAPLTALLPGLQALLAGGWLFAGVLTALVIRKPGAALYGELVAATVSALVGNQWGVLTLESGLVQGVGAELVFAVFLYRRWGLPVALAAGAVAGLALAINDLILWYPGSANTFAAIYTVSAIVSGALVAGLLSWFAVRGLAKTGALSRFASGRIGPDAR